MYYVTDVLIELYGKESRPRILRLLLPGILPSACNSLFRIGEGRGADNH